MLTITKVIICTHINYTFIFCIILTRSAASIYSIILALFTRLIFINRYRISFKIKKINILIIFLFLSMTIYLFYSFKWYFFHYLNVLYMKLVFINSDNLSISAQGRIERWQFTLDYYLNSSFYNMIFGYGPGYESAGGLDGGTTVNWYLNLLIDYGFIGLFIIVLAFVGAVKIFLKAKL